MAHNFRPDRIGEQIRDEMSQILAREVHDPGIGFVTLTRVHVTPDLQLARIYYTTLGDQTARKNTARALRRATPFLRTRIGHRISLRRVPEIEFFYDEDVEKQERVEQILRELHEEEAARAEQQADSAPPPDHDEQSRQD